MIRNSKYISVFSKAVVALLLLSNIPLQAQRNILFDDDWKFNRADDSTALKKNYNDNKWRKLDLPHDWSIEDIPGTNSPFDSMAAGGVNTGFTVGGTSWYRKTFQLPPDVRNKRIFIQFDGVYMNADVWVNGVLVGNHPYGYTSFYYDITNLIASKNKNTIAVRVKNEGKNSRWYSGSGIYRHVWLSILEPLHFEQWGTSITTPKVSSISAKLQIDKRIINSGNKPKTVTITTIVNDPAGQVIETIKNTREVGAGDTVSYRVSCNINNPSLWSPESPSIYTTESEISDGSAILDSETNSFGIRSITFNAASGFLLNGKAYKLKGGCVHHDNGPLGAKAYDKAEIRKVALLKASGFNAIRTSHNPPSPAFLHACDSMGMFIIDEAFDTWNEKKNKQDYNLYFNDWWQRDITSMITRDRNHPSIIMWSIGNEIPNRGKPEVGAVAKTISNFVHQLDSTRPVTAGVNGIDQKPEAFLDALDVAGYNYAVDGYDTDHDQYPSRVMYSSESFPLEAYKYWVGVKNHPWVIGDFVWTAFDYIGEASIGWLGYPQSRNFFPWNLAFCGDIDICGNKRPQSYYRDALWMDNQLALFVKPPTPTFPEWNTKLESWSRWNWHDVVKSWNWKGYEDSLLEVNIYSSCEEVELFLNDRSLGKLPAGYHSQYNTTFKVPYATGTLKAIGYSNGKIIEVDSIVTAGNPYAIRLSANDTALFADNQDLAYINVEVVDKSGNIVPDANIPVQFELKGPAAIVAVGNADPKNLKSFTADHITTWQGKSLLIVKASHKPGNIAIEAKSGNLAPASLQLFAAKSE